MPTWYARSFFAGVAIFDQEGFFSGTGFWTPFIILYPFVPDTRFLGFFSNSTRYRFQYTTHNAVLESGIGIACLEIESVGVKGIRVIYGD